MNWYWLGGIGLAVIIGVLASNQLLDTSYADSLVGLIIGGIGGYGVAVRGSTPKE